MRRRFSLVAPRNEQDHADRHQDQPRADQRHREVHRGDRGGRGADHHRGLLLQAGADDQGGHRAQQQQHLAQASPPSVASTMPIVGTKAASSAGPYAAQLLRSGRLRASRTPTSSASAANGSVYASGSATSDERR